MTNIKKKKKQGSDSEDEENKVTRKPGSPYVQNALDSDNSDDDETSAFTPQAMMKKRSKTTLDVGYLTGKGSFLPVTVLIH